MGGPDEGEGTATNSVRPISRTLAGTAAPATGLGAGRRLDGRPRGLHLPGCAADMGILED